MTRLLPLLAATCAAAMLAAGCTSDKPSPNFSSVTPQPDTSASSSTSATTAAPNTTANVPPGAVRPTLPAVSATHTYDGAFSFAPYYWKMVSWAYATNDGSVISNLYAATCKSCAAFEKNISDNVGYGYALRGGLIGIDAVNASKSLDGTPGAEYAIDCSLTVDALTVQDSAGKVVNTYPATSDRQRMYLAWSGDRWQIIDTAQVTVS